MKPVISILGGDLRQVYLARLLLADGRDVMTWGLEQGGTPEGVSLDRALEGDVLLLPLPVCKQGRLYLPLTDTELEAERLWPRLRYDQVLLGGMIGDLGRRLMVDYGLTMLDYYDREETQVANAVPTVEGAIQLAMESTDRTVHGSRCLIIGYGRIGRLLADRLLGLGAEVTVSARKYGDLAWIQAWGCQSVRTDALTGQLDRFDLIFNTAPALILDSPRLREIREDCVIIDLASAPGGVDLEEARRLGRQTVSAPGLPGKAAPCTAAAVIRDSVYHILEERGEPS
ncbi:MAG: dipicolinate synthase subunit DpsA [Oscillospiraceae bacterium]|nr:dipicolinate synthase subunit DpsA [Oscillospiraceae bacterium]